MSFASGALRSIASERLLRFQARKFGLSVPPTQRLRKVMVRNRSPWPGRSILMTFAPMSARSCVANGPCRRWLKSRMVTSERAFSVMALLGLEMGPGRASPAQAGVASATRFHSGVPVVSLSIRVMCQRPRLAV